MERLSQKRKRIEEYPAEVQDSVKNYFNQNANKNTYEVVDPTTRKKIIYTKNPDGTIEAFDSREAFKKENKDIWVDREVVKELCPECYEEMKKYGIRRINAGYIFNEWRSLPKGWTSESLKSFWNNIGGSITKCIEKMEGKVSNPEAFCISLKDRIRDTTHWRGEERKSQYGGYDVDKRIYTRPDGSKYKVLLRNIDSKEEAEFIVENRSMYEGGEVVEDDYNKGKYMIIKEVGGEEGGMFSEKRTSGYNDRGKRDGTGPYKDSYQRRYRGIGRRRQRGEPCPFEGKKREGKLRTILSKFIKNAPFKSPQQEAFLWINHPDIARKWYKEHGHHPKFKQYMKQKKRKKSK